MIQNFGGGEILAILILALVLLGPDRIPEMARNAGKLIHKLKTMTNGLQGQVQGMMDDPAMQPLKELGEFAARPRQKLAEYALEAEAEERARAEQKSMQAAEQDPAPEAGTDLDDVSSSDPETGPDTDPEPASNPKPEAGADLDDAFHDDPEAASEPGVEEAIGLAEDVSDVNPVPDASTTLQERESA